MKLGRFRLPQPAAEATFPIVPAIGKTGANAFPTVLISLLDLIQLRPLLTPSQNPAPCLRVFRFPVLHTFRLAGICYISPFEINITRIVRTPTTAKSSFATF